MTRGLSYAFSSLLNYVLLTPGPFWTCMRSILNRAVARHVITGLALATIYLVVPPAANASLRVVATPIAPFVLPDTCGFRSMLNAQIGPT